MFRAMWTANATAVWTGFRRNGGSFGWRRSSKTRSRQRSLRVLRNALEHLDNALFDEQCIAKARPDNKRAWSLRKARSGPCPRTGMPLGGRSFTIASRPGNHWAVREFLRLASLPTEDV